jgi:hypothetical protein
MSLPSEFEAPARCPSPKNFPTDEQLPKSFAEYYLAYARPLSIASDPFHLMAMLSCVSAVIGPRCHVRNGNLCIYPSIGPLQARGDRGTEIGGFHSVSILPALGFVVFSVAIPRS